MTDEQGSGLHPLAAQDITEIWEYIVQDSPAAARRVREEILAAIRSLVSFSLRRPSAPQPDVPAGSFVVREYLIA